MRGSKGSVSGGSRHPVGVSIRRASLRTAAMLADACASQAQEALAFSKQQLAPSVVSLAGDGERDVDPVDVLHYDLSPDALP